MRRSLSDPPPVIVFFFFFSLPLTGRRAIFQLYLLRRGAVTPESKLEAQCENRGLDRHIWLPLPTALTFAYSFKQKLLSDVCARVRLCLCVPACVYCGVYASPCSRFMPLTAAELAAAAAATLLGF